MASQRTNATELAAALGLFCEEVPRDRAALEAALSGREAGLEALGVPSGAVETVGRALDDAALRVDVTRALANSSAHRRDVLLGADPAKVEWLGGSRTALSSDVPADLRVNGVQVLSVKYGSSKCYLNASPSKLFTELLNTAVSGRSAEDWYQKVAPEAYQAYYDAVVAASGLTLPSSPADLDEADARALSTYTRHRRPSQFPEAAQAAYTRLCAEVSQATAKLWTEGINAASSAQQQHLVLTMLRIGTQPYWLHTADRGEPVRYAVMDRNAWKAQYALTRVEVTPGAAGQPQVDLAIEIRDSSGSVRTVTGACEIRWSHGKFQGPPEVKLQLTTERSSIPGYQPLTHSERAHDRAGQEPQPQHRAAPGADVGDAPPRIPAQRNGSGDWVQRSADRLQRWADRRALRRLERARAELVDAERGAERVLGRRA